MKNKIKIGFDVGLPGGDKTLYTVYADGKPLFSENHKRNTGRWWITDFIISIYYWIFGFKLTESNLEQNELEKFKNK